MDDEAIARQACSRWWWHRDRDDLLQVARLSAWQSAGQPDAHRVRRATSSVIEALRASSGRAGSYKARASHVQINDALDAPVELSPLPHVEYGLSGREAVVAALLAEGWRTAEIADLLGVSWGRVSQIKGEIRRRLS